MEYLFVDFENIAPKTVSDLPPDQMVFIFAGEKQTKIKTDLVVSMMARGAKAKLIQINGDGKNALDFHIAYYLGKLSESDKSASFKILSKDKGFDSLVNHLREAKIKCTRIEKVGSKAAVKVDWRAKRDAFLAHLGGIDEKKRPKKVPNLKAYLKSWVQNDETLVELIYQGLLSGKQIEVDGEKIKYLSTPAKKE